MMSSPAADLVSTGDCVWDDNDDATDVDGNLISGRVKCLNAGKHQDVFYAWIGRRRR